MFDSEDDTASSNVNSPKSSPLRPDLRVPRRIHVDSDSEGNNESDKENDVSQEVQIPITVSDVSSPELSLELVLPEETSIDQGPFKEQTPSIHLDSLLKLCLMPDIVDFNVFITEWFVCVSLTSVFIVRLAKASRK